MGASTIRVTALRIGFCARDDAASDFDGSVIDPSGRSRMVPAEGPGPRVYFLLRSAICCSMSADMRF